MNSGFRVDYLFLKPSAALGELGIKKVARPLAMSFPFPFFTSMFSFMGSSNSF
jgi:hypothetical protein